MSYLPILLLVPLVLVVLRRIFRSDHENPRDLPYPPGPRPKPLIGNLLDLPATHPWFTYAKLGKIHGDLISMKALGQTFVVINSETVAFDLLEKRSSVYSSRPYFAMVDLMGWEGSTAGLPYGDRWRLHRRIFQQYFRPEASQRYLSVQESKAHQLLRQLLDTPDHFLGHLKTLSASTIMELIYGIDVTSEHDPYIEVAEKSITMTANSLFPGAVLCNLIPSLGRIPAWFPGAGFKRYAIECAKLTNEMINKPIKFVRDNMADGKGIACIASELFENSSVLKNVADPETTIKHVSSTAYAGGVDTTHGVVSTAILSMVLNPSVQAKAQAEIDRVVGRDRLPDWSDRESLPYVGAVCREVLRWGPVIPLGVQRTTTENDVYKGMFIPKGSIVWANIWAMTRNESLYPDPENFKPERFLREDGSLNDQDPTAVFGFGRRICPGRHMAVNSVWMAIVSLLFTFNFSKARDAEGKEIPIVAEYGGGMVSHPLPYKCSITPRSDDARRLVLATSKV